MPIRALLNNDHFDEIKVLVAAFEEALQQLGLVDRADPAVLLIAERIISLAQDGERDPVRLRERAIKGDGFSP